MDAYVSEAASKLLTIRPQADFLDETRCAFLVGPEEELVLGCPSVIEAFCPKLWVPLQWLLSRDDQKPERLPPSVKVNAFKNIMQFLHFGTLDMCLLNDVVDYVDLVTTNHFLEVPEPLLQMSLRMLKLQVEPFNVWLVLSKLAEKPQLASVCDDVLTKSTWACLQNLTRHSLTKDGLAYFLKLDQMSISEVKILKRLTNSLRKKIVSEIVKPIAPSLLRFMTLKEEMLPYVVRHLKVLLSPNQLEAVTLAITTRDASKLPAGFQQTCEKRASKSAFNKSKMKRARKNIKGKQEQMNQGPQNPQVQDKAGNGKVEAKNFFKPDADQIPEQVNSGNSLIKSESVERQLANGKKRRRGDLFRADGIKHVKDEGLGSAKKCKLEKSDQVKQRFPVIKIEKLDQ